MPLDGITTFFLAQELNACLLGGRIDKVYQPDRYDIILHIRQESQNLRLLLSANPIGPRIHISSSTRDNPALPPSFCMLLRKHLSGSRITGISAPSYERIIEISIQATDELGDRKDKRLIIEMMGRYSNIILVNAENRIFDSLLHVDSQMSRVREVMPARPYEYPPVQGKIDPAEALQLLSGKQLPVLPASAHRPIEKALQESLLGFSPLLSREICYLASVDGRKGIHQLLPKEIDALCLQATLLLTRITEGRVQPTTYSLEAGSPPTDFHALYLQDAGHALPAASISAAMDSVYRFKDQTSDFEQKKRRLLQFCHASLQHAIRKQSVHQADVFACREMDSLQKSGQLLLANHYRIPAGVSSYDAIDFESAEDSLYTIEMDSTKSVSQNAQSYFRRYAKCKSRLESASEFLLEDNRAVEYLSTLYLALESASDNDDLQALREEMQISGLLTQENGQTRTAGKDNTLSHQAKFPGKSKSGGSSSRALRSAGKAASKRSKTSSNKEGKSGSASAASNFRKYPTPGGNTILCGRNNIQNDLLTMKTASPDDLWFHVQKMPGTHVVLRCENSSAVDSEVLLAAQTAAFFSRTASRNEKNKASDPRQARRDGQEISELKIAVDYCPVKNVKKPPRSKPGMVIYDHYRTLLVSPSDPGKLL